MKTKAQAPGQYYGFSLQQSRFVSYLLKAKPGTSVSLEVFEDVGVAGPGTTIAEQVKSAAKQNPVADNSPQLWKTFANWGESCESRVIDPAKCEFRLYVSKRHSAPLATSLSNAQTLPAAAKALENAIATVAKSKTNDLQKQLARLNGIPKPTLAQIIKNFTLEFGSGSAQTDLSSEFTTVFLGEEIVEDVVVHALGWVKKKTDLLLERNRPAVVSFNEFRGEMTSYIRKIDTRRMLTDFSREPSTADIRKGMLSTYVQQLDVVECDDEERIRAVRSFLRAIANVIEWSNRSLVHVSSIREFEDSLEEFWRNSKKQQDLDYESAPAVERGKRLLFACLAARRRFEGLDTPDYFTSGVFHGLADEVRIGWHPDYKKLFKKSRKK